VKDKPEHVVLDEERVSGWFEYKVLHEGLGRIVISLQLSQDVDEDSSVKHWLAVHGGDDVLDLLEGEASQLLHDLGGPLHLLALKRQQGLLRVVERLEVGPCGRIVKNIVILLSEGLANLLVLRVERHDGSKVNFSFMGISSI